MIHLRVLANRFLWAKIRLRPSRFTIGILGGLLFCVVTPSVWGQPPQAELPVVDSPLTTLRSQVAASELTDEEKKPLLDRLSKVEAQTTEAKQKLELSSRTMATTETAAARAETLNSEIKSLVDFQPIPTTVETLPELETALQTVEAELVKARSAVTEAETAMAQSAQRRRQIETEMPALEKQLEERRPLLEATQANPEGLLPLSIQLVELRSSVALLEATIAAMKSELASIEVETNVGLYQLKRDVSARRVETIQQQEKVNAAAVEKSRADDAIRRVQAAAEQLKELHSALIPIGEQNTQLAETNKQLTAKIDEAKQLLTRRILRLEELKAAYNQARVRVETVGLTDAVGAMLRNLKQELPSAGAYLLRGRERQPEINDAQYLLIELTDQRNLKLDITVAALLRSANPPVPPAQRAELELEARTLLERQRSEYLDPAIRSQTIYFNTLVSLSTTEQQIVEVVDESGEYANERILWIRSSKPLHEQFQPTPEEWWFTIGNVWETMPTKLSELIQADPLVWSGAFLLLIVLLRLKARLRQQIAAIGKQVAQSKFALFVPTLQSLFLTILAALPIPFVCGFLAWRLGLIAGNDPALVSIVQAASAIAVGYFPLEFLRQACRSNGLGISHFEWPTTETTRLRRALKWLILTALPLITVTSFLHAGTLTFGNDTLERYFYLGAIGVITMFTFRMMHPGKGLLAVSLRMKPSGWMNRTAFAWYPVLVAIPSTLGVLALTGYYFTSQQFAWRLFYSLFLVLAIVVVVSLVLRWVVVHQRRLRIEESRKRREAVALAAETLADASTVKSTVLDTPVIAPVDSARTLQTQMLQTRRLLNTAVLAASLIGAWVVWNDVVPALGILENWPLWTSTSTITEYVPNVGGVPSGTSREVPDPVTIADLLFAGFLLTITFVATTNLPGLLGFSVLRRLPIDNSVGYAITTLSSYAIVLIGLITAGQAIGLHWAQIQWMATALTFGLAFGLQEMFANFIAGIIILFEQPVRVGDVVEIDGVTGVVSKIRIRATTITNWDRMDYIVPNKEFITSKLLNWTRSDEIMRIGVDVGIA
jgi:potassium efflux system protein